MATGCLHHGPATAGVVSIGVRKAVCAVGQGTSSRRRSRLGRSR
jgi:hypothetical protein